MKQGWKKMLGSVVMSLLVFLSCQAVFAAEFSDGDGTVIPQEVSYYYICENPLYGDGEIRSLEEPTVSYSSRAVVPSFSTQAEGISYFRNSMTQRQQSISFQIPVSRSEIEVDAGKSFAGKVFYAALTDTGNLKPYEGDYLAFQYGGWASKVKYTDSASASTLLVTLEYTVVYYTTQEQEEQVTQGVNSVLDSLHLAGLSPYRQVWLIYDYVCSHVEYDHKTYTRVSAADALKSPAAYEAFRKERGRYTAYNALMNGSAVCQGYSNLLYRMLKEVGIDTRIISGTAGAAHSWNIIGLDGLYYNADSTWDAGYAGNGNPPSYRYFLKSMADFPGHTRDNGTMNGSYKELFDYVSDAFNARYPMSPESYSACITGDVHRGGHATCKARAVCIMCGKSYGPLGDHTWSDYHITREPTYMETGLEERTCTVCGEKETRMLPMKELTSLKTPVLVSAKAVSGQKLRFTWEQVPYATGYRVYRKETGGWKIQKNVSGSVSSYTDEAVKPGVVYTYTVRACHTNPSGRTIWSNFHSGVKGAAKLKAPILKSAKSLAYNKIQFTWEAVPGAIGYRVYRKTTGSWKALGNVSAQTTSYIDGNAATGTAYTYTVRAYCKSAGADLWGEYSTKGITATAVPGKAQITSVTADASHKNTISWKAVPGATGYQVFLKEKNGELKRLAVLGQTSYVHTGLKKGTAYTYTVRAYRKIASQPVRKYSFGAFSAEKTVRAK